MPNIPEIIAGINEVFKLIFGQNVPVLLSQIVGVLLAIALVLLGIWGFLLISSKIIKLWKDEFWPLFYNPDERRRVAHRRRFADHMESEIRHLNNLEIWSDYRFAELEAEVEAEGRRQAFNFLPFASRTRSGLRRERSLSKALETSRERLILLEGDPGSGKSVALRHVAQAMAKRAMKARATQFVIPIYVNLKELVRHKNEAIDSALVRSFILRFLNRANDRDIEEFLEKEFDRGLEEGTWLFLFDSFDELPELLSSTEADTAIRKYGDAIYSFLHGMNKCRGVVASRQFRGPGQFGWPRFRIVPLSEERRLELVRKFELNSLQEREIIGQLGTTTQEIRIMASNPMFLALLCEHVKSEHPFPENAHVVFETYINTRLVRDAERLERRFHLSPMDIRGLAEHVAFCMAGDPGLGLSPTRQNLKSSMTQMGFEIKKTFEMSLDAIEYIKLARSESATQVGESRTFSFAHRRFQEYFATCVVLREPNRVTPLQLLTDARWRETAVVVCQTQPPEVTVPIIAQARNLLIDIANQAPELISQPDEYIQASESEEKPKDKEKPKDTERDVTLPSPYLWPSGMSHVLGLLQDGFRSHLSDLPNEIRDLAASLVLTAFERGILIDKKWALEIAGSSSDLVLLHLLRRAFQSQSQWLKEVAYRQVAWLHEIPEDIARGIRKALVNLAASGRLSRERHATYAHLSRLNSSSEYLDDMRLLLWAPRFDLFFHVVLLLLLLLAQPKDSFLAAVIVLVLFLSCTTLWWLFPPRGGPLDSVGSFVAIYARAGIVWAFPHMGLAIFPLAGITLTGISVLLLSWAPLAIITCQMGGYTNVLCWPLIWIWPPIQLVRRMNRKSLVEIVAAGVVGIAILIVGIALLTAIMSALVAGFRLFFDSFVKSNLPTLYDAIISLWTQLNSNVAVVGGLVVVVLAIPFVLRWTKDWIRWYQWSRKSASVLTVHALLSLLNQFHNETFSVRAIRFIREQALLAQGSETEDILSKLILAIYRAKLERRKKALRRKEPANKSQGQEPTEWTPDPCLAEFARNDARRLARLGADFLDELCMLLEKVRAKK